jgi:hypothetical protein
MKTDPDLGTAAVSDSIGQLEADVKSALDEYHRARRPHSEEDTQRFKTQFDMFRARAIKLDQDYTQLVDRITRRKRGRSV